MERAVHKYNIVLPDRELACALGNSKEAEDYYQAMACAVNYAFANRQAIMHWIRQGFQQVFKEDAERFGLKLVYDVAHNIAKIENHRVNGEQKKVWVHRFYSSWSGQNVKQKCRQKKVLGWRRKKGFGTTGNRCQISKLSSFS
jgi:RNA-splicing ligase RtcB